MLALIVAACGGGGEEAAPSDIEPLPAIELVSFADGSVSTLNDYVGKPLVVNFWAEWCPSCVAEMSSAFKPVRESLDGEVTFIGVNIQDSRERALGLLEQTDVGWVSVENQDGSLWTELGGLAMPFTVFIDADGVVADRHNGPLNESLLRQRIEEKILR